MPPLLMTGFDRQHLPTRTVRDKARSVDEPLALALQTGQIRAWDLLSLRASLVPGAPEWAEKTLNAIISSADLRVKQPLECSDCTDLGFYGLVSAADADVLTGLLRREGEGGYEQLTASGSWVPYQAHYEHQVEILSRELAGDLAEAITAGAAGLARRYFWPQAFLPPETMIAAAPAPELVKAEDVASGDQPALDTEDVADGGWVTYAVVDDLDPGAVLDLIRLRRGSSGPELVVYRNGVWGEDSELLSDLQGVQPPPLVELTKGQLADVLVQIGGEGEGSEDSGDPGEGLDEADKSEPVAAAGALVADAPLTVSPDPRAEKLRRYWTTGKGALKIRWGTDGDWTRCYRQLRKHMGVRAKGYCQNLHKRATGQWAGSRANRGRTAAVAASGRTVRSVLSMEAALVAAVSTGSWRGPQGGDGVTSALKDGVYTELGREQGLLKTLTAGGFPVAPPDDWFADPGLEAPTPLTVDDDGRVHGHIATFDVAHIGLPGQVKAPRSRSDYAYFKTGQLVTASGAKVNVGQLTLAGGHASLQADAAAAVAHYDNTASACADVNVGEDKFGIWVAGGLRPEITPAQLRTLRASAPSGDWRPINGNLELVACCQVNVPGFPTVRARVAGGAIMAMVAAGSGPLYARRIALMADAANAERLAALESIVYPMIADGEGAPVAEGGIVTDETVAVEPDEETTVEVSDAIQRARALAAERRAARESEAAATEQPGDVPVAEAVAEETEQEESPDAVLARLRARVHGGVPETVAASGSGD